MHYKHLTVVLLIFLNSCVNYPINIDKNIETKQKKNYFLNIGFALVYNDDLYKKKLIESKIENRSIIIFQRNLKKSEEQQLYVYNAFLNSFLRVQTASANLNDLFHFNINS